LYAQRKHLFECTVNMWQSKNENFSTLLDHHLVLIYFSVLSLCLMSVKRRYSRPLGTGHVWKSGNWALASEFDRRGLIIHDWLCFQSAGVATLCLAVSWRESTTRRISLKNKWIIKKTLDLFGSSFHKKMRQVFS
jgi:hypothetical protein